jgi:predicted nucleic acid-binding protein
LSRSISPLCSFPLFLGYESVLLRPEQLGAGGMTENDAIIFLNVLAGLVIPIEMQFLWRPQMRDPNDDMLLELAVNGPDIGDDVCIITFSQGDFLPEVNRFGITLQTPKQFLQGK